MKQLGSRTDKMGLFIKSEADRGMIATKSVKWDEEVLFVPDEAIVSLYRARSVKWSKQLILKGFDLSGVYKESAYMVIYMMHLS